MTLLKCLAKSMVDAVSSMAVDDLGAVHVLTELARIVGEAAKEKMPGKAVQMTRPTYPAAAGQDYIPFYFLACSCGVWMWSLLGEITPCPNCGKIMRREGAADGSH